MVFSIDPRYIFYYNQDMGKHGLFKHCTYKDCIKPHKAKGYCHTHYKNKIYNKTEKGRSFRNEYMKKYFRKPNSVKNSLAVKKYKATDKGKLAFLRASKMRQQRIKQQTPKWANTYLIKQFYLQCPKGFSVDHIIPLAGKEVSGFHVLENLRYLPISDNRKKSSKFIMDLDYKAT